MFIFRKIFGLSVLFFGILSASVGQAHVKWFVDTDEASKDGVQMLSVADMEVQDWILLALSLIIFSMALDSRLPKIRILDTKTCQDFIEILRVFTGMSLLLTSYEGALIAPHLKTYGTFGACLVFFEAVIGIMLFANRFIWHTAVCMLILQMGVVIQFGILPAVEYFVMVGIAVFLLLNNLRSPLLIEMLKPYSVDALRICTGISLVTLGFCEKLLRSVLGQSFIYTYNWDFLVELGFDFFTDSLFVLSIGMMEVVFGTVLILGTITRLNIVAISILMVFSNVVFIIQGRKAEALVEFVGHMPMIATALVLLLLGYGQRLKITKLLPSRWVSQKMPTISLLGDV